jgi:sugar lactone lactonase YvrE
MQVVGTFREVLGEGPVWCEIEQALYWTDIRRKLIRRHSPATGETVTWELPEIVGSFALRRNGGLIVAMRSDIVLFDPSTGRMERLAAPDADKPNHRFNDGKCDPKGRFVVGSMDDVTRDPTGSLWSVSADGSCRALLSNCRIPNGLAWSPDGGRMYFADTGDGAIRVYDYDLATGAIGSERTIAQLDNGAPDGATVDEQGYYWSAVYGGWRVERRAPDGRLDATFDVPVQNPTSCAFGGLDLDQLYVTSASQRLSTEELAAQPLAGAVMVLQVGVRGLPSTRFDG